METTSVIWFCSRKDGDGDGEGHACLMESFFFLSLSLSAENKQDIFHLHYFIQLEGEESLPSTGGDGKHKGSDAAGEARRATGFQVPPGPMTTCTAERDRERRLQIHTHVHHFQDLFLHTLQYANMRAQIQVSGQQ